MILLGTANDGFPVFNNKDEAFNYFLSVNNKNLVYDIFRKEERRTAPQNNSIHRWLGLVAKELNERGLTKSVVLSNFMEADWTVENAKEELWRPTQRLLYPNTISTKDLPKQIKIDNIYEHLNRFLAQEPMFIHIPVPNDPDKNKPAVTDKEYPKESYNPSF